MGESLFELGFFRIVLVPPNSGAAFGIFQGHMSVLAVISIVSVAALILFSIFGPRRFPWLNSMAVYFSLGMVLGGTVGNLIERLRPDLGGVTDFISVGIWPTFNLADSAIVVGILLFSYHLIYRLKDS